MRVETCRTEFCFETPLDAGEMGEPFKELVVFLSELEPCKSSCRSQVLLGKVCVAGNVGHLIRKMGQNHVDVSNEVEINYGPPRNPFFCPLFAGISKLKVCKADSEYMTWPISLCVLLFKVAVFPLSL